MNKIDAFLTMKNKLNMSSRFQKKKKEISLKTKYIQDFFPQIIRK